MVTILILVDGFLQSSGKSLVKSDLIKVTILILVDGFLQYLNLGSLCQLIRVTILILVDGFLQLFIGVSLNSYKRSHNPYFSRWFSAISTRMMLGDGYMQSQSLF